MLMAVVVLLYSEWMGKRIILHNFSVRDELQFEIPLELPGKSLVFFAKRIKIIWF